MVGLVGFRWTCGKSWILTGLKESSISDKMTRPVRCAQVLSGLIDLAVRPDNGETLNRQLYNGLRGAILNGALAPGRRLPSSRELARQLKLSRNTVSGVIDQLAMEGYLQVAQGRRPVVATAKPALVRGKPAASAASRAMQLSHWAKRLPKANWPAIDEGAPRPFQPGLGDTREFPHELWARCLRRAARMAPSRGTQAVNSPALQAALLKYLVEHRGVRARADQVIIVPSAQAAIELTARVVLNANDLAWLESPGYSGARAALEAAGARVVGVPLDGGGIAIGERSDRPRLIFVTPSHQYPLGARLAPTQSGRSASNSSSRPEISPHSGNHRPAAGIRRHGYFRPF